MYVVLAATKAIGSAKVENAAIVSPFAWRRRFNRKRVHAIGELFLEHRVHELMLLQEGQLIE